MPGLKYVLYDRKTLQALQSAKSEVLYLSIAAIFKNLQEAWRPFRTADTKVNVLSKKPLLCTLQYMYLMIHNITFSEEKIAKNYNWPFKTVETPSK